MLYLMKQLHAAKALETLLFTAEDLTFKPGFIDSLPAFHWAPLHTLVVDSCVNIYERSFTDVLVLRRKTLKHLQVESMADRDHRLWGHDHLLREWGEQLLLDSFVVQESKPDPSTAPLYNIIANCYQMIELAFPGGRVISTESLPGLQKHIWERALA